MGSTGKRYTEEQIIRIVKELETGTTVEEASRRHGVSEGAIYRWKQKYGGMEVSEARRLRLLESENARLKRIVAQQAMDIEALKELLSKKW
jgi:putative transposase